MASFESKPSTFETLTSSLASPLVHVILATHQVTADDKKFRLEEML
jgi:hypothetical protein